MVPGSGAGSSPAQLRQHYKARAQSEGSGGDGKRPGQATASLLKSLELEPPGDREPWKDFKAEKWHGLVGA